MVVVREQATRQWQFYSKAEQSFAGWKVIGRPVTNVSGGLMTDREPGLEFRTDSSMTKKNVIETRKHSKSILLHLLPQHV